MTDGQHPQKAVILARGLGTRMRTGDPSAKLEADQAAVADSGVKGLIPVGRPFLDYVIAALADAGCTDVCIVLAPGPSELRDRYTRHAVPDRVKVHFAVQEQPLGTADAVLAVEAFAGNDPFMVVNSDNYYPVDVLRGLRQAPLPALPGFDREALLSDGDIPPERIASFALLETDGSGALTRIVEKPDADRLAAMDGAAMVSMNCWAFTATILDACRSIGPSPRGELELPDAVQLLVDRGERFTVLPVSARVLDLSRRSDIPRVRERLAGLEVLL